MTDIQITEYITQQCEMRGINLCGNFEEWTKVAFSLADLGEAGRQYFHRLARMDEHYKERENEAKFTNALRTSCRVKFPTLLYLAKQHGISFADIQTQQEWHHTPRIRLQRHISTQVDYLPIGLIKDVQIGNNTLIVNYLCTYFDLVDVLTACNRYMIRSTPQGETVFPQVDTLGRLRTGKIIAYGEDGHRIKSRYADWLHARYMRMQGKTAQDFHLQQCLFGEHLLKEKPSAQVAVVEAEKTALILSIVFPQTVWLAVGGKMNLTAEKCRVLAGRNVILYPDADAVQEWTEHSKALTFCKSVRVSDWWTSEPKGSKRDIADVVMAQRTDLSVRRDKVSSHCAQGCHS